MPRVRRCRYPGCHAMVKLPDHYCAKHYEHEAEYLANRQRWARSHGKQYQHKYNTQTRYRNAESSKRYNFYQTKQWSSLRKQVLERDHYICQYCGRPNSRTVDHTVPLAVDHALAADPDNLATICRRCHRVKTEWEQSYYGTGKDNQLTGAHEIENRQCVLKLMRAHESDFKN